MARKWIWHMGYMAYVAMYDQAAVLNPDIGSVEEACAESLKKHAQALKEKGLDVAARLEMGTYGGTGIAHALLCRTAEKVVWLAACPVLTIRPN